MEKIVNGVAVPMNAEEIEARQAEEAAWPALAQARDAAAARDASMDQAIAGDATIAQLRAMTSADFDIWWAANVTNLAQANNILKRLTRLAIRRLL